MNTENKLFAKFMDAEHWIDDSAIQVYRFKNGQSFDLNQMKYDTSYDWIMPVVEKIESLVGYFSVATDQTLVEIYQGNKRLISRNSGTRLKSLYEAVLIFIKWYNTQPKKS